MEAQNDFIYKQSDVLNDIRCSHVHLEIGAISILTCDVAA